MSVREIEKFLEQREMEIKDLRRWPRRPSGEAALPTPGLAGRCVDRRWIDLTAR